MIAYLLDRELEHMKIGLTRNPEKYLQSISWIVRTPLELLTFEDGYAEHRRARCRQLAKYAVAGAHGNWFVYTPKVEALIVEIAMGLDRIFIPRA